MSTARSVFTEAIEDHLALEKQNTTLEQAMPLARYDVGDPLDRYPGGPNRAGEAGTVVVAENVEAAFDVTDSTTAPDATQMLVGPSPEQAMEAATALEPTFADRPFEPLNGLAPMLSLVEDIDEDDDAAPADAFPTETPTTSADVLRFPGGVGPRVEAVASDEPQLAAPIEGQLPMETHAFTMPEQPQVADSAVAHDAPTGEQPVLVIDADEPIATSDWSEPAAPARSSRSSRPRFFGLGRKKQSKDEADGWFTDGPRDFNWD